MKLSKSLWFSIMLGFSVGMQATPVTFIAPTQITAGSFTISSAGYYQLLDDTTFSGANGTSAITISANNVTLDLNGKKLISGNTNTTNAINVTSAAKNIIIQNGIIDSFVTTGVKVDTATSYTNIVLSDLTINGRTGGSTRGIGFTNVFNGFIKRCTVVRETTGVLFTTCDNVTIVDSQFNDTFGRGINVSSCTNFLLDNCQVNRSFGDGAIGMQLVSCVDFTVRNCSFNDNISNTASTAFGEHNTTCRNLFFYNCEFSQNRNSSTGGALGVVLSGCTGCIWKDCFFMNNRSPIAQGAGLQLTSNAHGNLFDGCICADNGSDGAGTAMGFDFASTATNNFFVRCKALRNNSATGGSRGFSLSTSSANVLRLCEVYDNTGGGSNIGFSDNNGAVGTNAYYGCVASKNGTNFASSISFATWSLSGGTFTTAVTNLPGDFYNVEIVA